MKKNLFIVPIEPIENRYPGDWHKHIPEQFEQFCEINGISLSVHSIDGKANQSQVDDSTFLNFVDTAYWKSSQMAEIAKLFSDGKVKDGDIFLVTDAWNPCVHLIRYMSKLCDLNVRLVGVWHAGTYDRYDILGQTFVGDSAKWASSLETSMGLLYDTNIFATNFHRKMFLANVPNVPPSKCVTTSFPMEYMRHKLKPFIDALLCGEIQKKNQVVFPHRLSYEKQPKYAYALKEALAEHGIDVVITKDCEEIKTPNDYYRVLAESKLCFSAALQETLGIAQFEAMMLGATPFVPRRLSYEEMYFPYHFYDPSLTADGEISKDEFERRIRTLADMIVFRIDRNDVVGDGEVMAIFTKFFDGNSGFYQKVLGF